MSYGLGSRTRLSDGAVAPLPDPVRFVFNEHDRQLEACSALEGLVNVMQLEPVEQRAATLLGFMTEDLPLHIEDEEQDLFPLLLSRRADRRDIEPMLAQLTAEHEDDKELARLIVVDLQAIAGGHALDQPARFHRNVRIFCELQRRHLVWENRLVLPMADRCLSLTDKTELGRRMIKRRESGRGRRGR